MSVRLDRPRCFLPGLERVDRRAISRGWQLWFFTPPECFVSKGGSSQNDGIPYWRMFTLNLSIPGGVRFYQEGFLGAFFREEALGKLEEPDGWKARCDCRGSRTAKTNPLHGWRHSSFLESLHGCCHLVILRCPRFGWFLGESSCWILETTHPNGPSFRVFTGQRQESESSWYFYPLLFCGFQRASARKESRLGGSDARTAGGDVAPLRLPLRRLPLHRPGDPPLGIWCVGRRTAAMGWCERWGMWDGL